MICADRKFPRGDAGANRILFMAKALLETGWDVFVISTGRSEEKYYDKASGCHVYEGVKYKNVAVAPNRYVRMFQHQFLDGKNTVKLLREIGLAAGDVVLLYSTLYSFSSAVIEYTESVGCRTACDVVEWHQPFQFLGGERNIRYKGYKRYFDELVPRTRNVIAISGCLERHFAALGCRTAVVPIYVDTDSRPSWKRSLDHDRLHLIYPGNPYRKDDLQAMLRAIDMLGDAQKRQVCFHLTGVNRRVLRASVPGEERLLDALAEKEIVCIHDWMEYDELMRLYRKIDFALIARPDNIVTQANFPSKVPELMSRGIPVITNRVGDIAAYLDDAQDAIIYGAPTAQACKEAIERAIAMTDEQRIAMSKRAYENAKLKFSYHLCSDKLDQFFSEMR